MTGPLPPLPDGAIYRLDLSQAATSRLLKKHPLHRWFYFPHSYSPELVEVILDAWGLSPNSYIVDPFVGAGTTLLVAKERGYRALGTDLSPLAILVSNAKVASYDPSAIRLALRTVLDTVQSSREYPGEVSPRLARALTETEYTLFWRLRQAIQQISDPIQGFILVGLISILPQFSRAISDGGWFRWVDKPEQANHILPTFQTRIDRMLAEVKQTRSKKNSNGLLTKTKAVQHDARYIHTLYRGFDGLITSPPYPNRHDYTRVFQIELLSLGYSEDDIFQIRHNSLRSHVEAHPPVKVNLEGYGIPEALQVCLDKLPSDVDPRIPQLLRGYFEDMYLVLQSARRSMSPEGKLAFVVGNVRHAGVLIPVDEILAAVGEIVGFKWTGTWVIRLRGNSAQQMGKYGRMSSRESVVFFAASNGD